MKLQKWTGVRINTRVKKITCSSKNFLNNNWKNQQLQDWLQKSKRENNNQKRRTTTDFDRNRESHLEWQPTNNSKRPYFCRSLFLCFCLLRLKRWRGMIELQGNGFRPQNRSNWNGRWLQNLFSWPPRRFHWFQNLFCFWEHKNFIIFPLQFAFD